MVISGMVLNTLLSGDAEAQGGVKDATFRNVYCESLIIKDGYKWKGKFGLSDSGDAILEILGDDGKTGVAYLGGNATDPNHEMIFSLQSKSKTDKREASITINENGGRFDGHNKMGEQVVRIGVGDSGGGGVGTYDKFGYRR